MPARRNNNNRNTRAADQGWNVSIPEECTPPTDRLRTVLDNAQTAIHRGIAYINNPSDAWNAPASREQVVTVTQQALYDINSMLTEPFLAQEQLKIILRTIRNQQPTNVTTQVFDHPAAVPGPVRVSADRVPANEVISDAPAGDTMAPI